MSGTWSLVCGLCAQQLAGEEAFACPACGGAAVVRYESHPERIAAESGHGIWRYRNWLPVEPDSLIVTLGEGNTPLIRLERWPRQIGLEHVYAKLEYVGPTGSFKDRGSSVLISHAGSLGVQRLTEDSSGNAGASIAAYAARAGMECAVFAPASTMPSKLSQIRSYGAILATLDVPRAAVAHAAQLAGREAGSYYAGHNTNPYFVEGCKTLAFELAEAFDFDVPDHVLMPVGGGSLYCGAGLGFRQLHAAGRTRSFSRLHVVQASGCMPLVAAFDAGADAPLPVQRRPTVAGGIEIEHPVRGSLILRTLRETAGSAVAVEDGEILSAQRALARLEGIFMEPTSAAAFAGLARLAAAGTIGRTDRAVVVVTGTGLKDPESIDSGSGP